MPPPSDEITAFQRSGQTPAQAYEQASRVELRFIAGSGLLGCFVGLMLGLRLIALSRSQIQTDYRTDRAACISCGRCYDYCPKEYERRGSVGESSATPSPTPALLTAQGK